MHATLTREGSAVLNKPEVIRMARPRSQVGRGRRAGEFPKFPHEMGLVAEPRLCRQITPRRSVDTFQQPPHTAHLQVGFRTDAHRFPEPFGDRAMTVTAG